ncbi:hypothetical protein [Vibrio sp. WXL103]|uniref:hypothetical protein n=1 Tax=Vibrio sp. WXL103 TaxID=3450710 RepID=UPI003EC6BF35
MENKLIASVQYDDWKGSVALDDADDLDVTQYAKDQGKIPQEALIVGVDAYFHSISNEFSVKLYYSTESLRDVDVVPNNFQTVSLDIPAVEFLKLFKRVNIAFSWHGEMS